MKTALKRKGKPAKELKRKPASKPKKEAGRLDVLKEQLQKMKEEIISGTKSEIKKRVTGDVIEMSGDDGDMSQASSDNDIRLGKLSVQKAALEKIDEALFKIGRGTYGKCDECGNDIPLGRLKAMPFATLCVPCQTEAEQLDRIERSMARED